MYLHVCGRVARDLARKKSRVCRPRSPQSHRGRAIDAKRPRQRQLKARRQKPASEPYSSAVARRSRNFCAVEAAHVVHEHLVAAGRVGVRVETPLLAALVRKNTHLCA